MRKQHRPTTTSRSRLLAKRAPIYNSSALPRADRRATTPGLRPGQPMRRAVSEVQAADASEPAEPIARRPAKVGQRLT